MLHQKWLEAKKSEGESGIWSTRGTKAVDSEGTSSSSPGFLDLSTFHILDCNPISEVIFPPIGHILFVRSKSPGQGEGFTQVFIPGGRDHGELFQKLPTARSFQSTFIFQTIVTRKKMTPVSR